MPTEAQWEYAARGPAGRNYPWGGMASVDKKIDGWDETNCANGDNSFVKDISTWPVGSFPAGASWSGAYDLAGNVWEWSADWYSNYPTTKLTNPTGPVEGKRRVLRGGSWDGDNKDNRSARRINNAPGNWGANIGFRCVSLSPTD